MTFRDLVGSACTGLLQQKLRTLLTIGGVALGSMLLFCSIAGGIGVLNALHNRLSIGDRLLQIRVSSGFRAPSEDVEAEFRNQIPKEVSEERRRRLAKAMAMRSGRKGTAVPLLMTDVRSFSKLKGVQHVTPSLQWQSVIEIDGQEWPGGRVRAVQADDASINELIVAGQPLSQNSADEVLVSEAFLFSKGIYSDDAINAILGSQLVLKHARKSGLLSKSQQEVTANAISIRERLLDEADLPNAQRALVESEIADLKLRLAKHRQAEVTEVASNPFKVVGVYSLPDKDGFQSNSSLVDAFYNQILLPSETAATFWSEINPPNRAVTAKVLAADSQSAKQIVGELKQRGFTCTSLADLAMRIRSAVLMVSAIVTAIAAAAFFIAALGMTNTMIMNVLERRREIGILKSIGAKDRDILQMFLTEGLIVGLAGGLIGLGIGVMVSVISSGYIRQFLEQRLEEPIQDSLFAYPLWLIICTPVIAGCVTVMASLLPARQASRLDPVATLRSL
jgi:putative ABC transport system permease protein